MVSCRYWLWSLTHAPRKACNMGNIGQATPASVMGTLCINGEVMGCACTRSTLCFSVGIGYLFSSIHVGRLLPLTWPSALVIAGSISALCTFFFFFFFIVDFCSLFLFFFFFFFRVHYRGPQGTEPHVALLVCVCDKCVMNINMGFYNSAISPMASEANLL